jgi:neutral trehalase
VTHWVEHVREAGDVVIARRGRERLEYPTQDGFGWTSGVMLKLMALYPADADLESADLCPAGHGS